jgi:hypothetical protein
MLLPQMGNRQPRLDLKVVGGHGGVWPASNGRGTGDLAIDSGGRARLHVQFTALTAGAPISGMHVLYPPDLLDEYQVAAAVLRTGPAFEQRRARLEAAGLRRVMDIGGYVLMARDKSNSFRIPGWASDGGTPARGGLP